MRRIQRIVTSLSLRGSSFLCRLGFSRVFPFLFLRPRRLGKTLWIIFQGPRPAGNVSSLKLDSHSVRLFRVHSQTEEPKIVCHSYSPSIIEIKINFIKKFYITDINYIHLIQPLPFLRRRQPFSPSRRRCRLSPREISSTPSTRP